MATTTRTAAKQHKTEDSYISHLTKIAIALREKSLVERLAKEFKWTLERNAKFTNPYSKETVENATLFKDSSGKVRMVLDSTNTPVVDAWSGSMGRDYERFLNRYTTAFIQQTAAMDGGSFREVGVDQQGNTLIEVTYN